MRIWLKNMNGDSIGRVDVRDDVFDAPANPALVHQVVVGQLANARQGTANARTRAEVSGGGRKPRPQKHTGMARAGTIRSPLWVGGGVAFGPKPRSYRQRTPKRMRRMALVSALSDKAREGSLVVVDSLEFEEEVKTRELAAMLIDLDVQVPALLVADGAHPTVVRASRNIQRLKTLPADLLSALDLVNSAKVVMTVEAVRKAEELWGGVRKRRRTSGSAAA